MEDKVKNNNELLLLLKRLSINRKMNINTSSTSTIITTRFISIDEDKGFIIGVNDEGQATLIHLESVTSIELIDEVDLNDKTVMQQVISDHESPLNILSVDEPIRFSPGEMISTIDLEMMTNIDETHLIIQYPNSSIKVELPPNKILKEKIELPVPISSDELLLKTDHGTITIFHLEKLMYNSKWLEPGQRFNIPVETSLDAVSVSIRWLDGGLGALGQLYLDDEPYGEPIDISDRLTNYTWKFTTRRIKKIEIEILKSKAFLRLL